MKLGNSSRQTLSVGGWGLGMRLVSLRLTEQPYFAKLNFKGIIIICTERKRDCISHPNLVVTSDTLFIPTAIPQK